jgi:hypothetical protein
MRKDLLTREDLLIYIDSLDTGEPLTVEEWRQIIDAESADYAQQDDRCTPLTETEVKMILDKLEEDGYIRG